jgi:Uma2 family endonuclease
MATTPTLPKLELPYFRFDAEQFRQLQEQGWFNGDKVELHDGILWNYSSAWSNGEPALQRFTLEQYYWMGEQNWFEGYRVMLLEGELLTMPTPKPGHAYSVEETGDRLRNTVEDDNCHVRLQAPLHLSDVTDTEPDISVVSGRRRDYRTRHPTTALMLLEVSDTTLYIDRGRKASLYARAQILDYWIINLVDRQVEVHRQPQPDPSKPHGYGYAEIIVYQPGQQIAPLCKPEVFLAVNDMLP